MSTPSHSSMNSGDHRPEFMVTLGLAPPYAIEDVNQAYREQAKRAHPDRGGTAAGFHRIHQAFEQAQAYLEFRTDRRAWIAGKMARYVALEQAIARVARFGVAVTTATPLWLKQSFGDFAQLTETPTVARAIDAPNGDAIITALVADHVALRDLEAIELVGSRVTDDAVLMLSAFQQLRRLNLANTPVTRRVLALIDDVPTLETLALEGTGVGWWARRSAARRLRRRAVADGIPAAVFKNPDQASDMF